MTPAAWLSAGFTVLAVLWLGPLPALARSSFSAHMLLHIAVVAIAAPLLAIGAAGGPLDPSGRWPRLFNPIVASGAELIVFWIWHAPALHDAARARIEILFLEQASFLAAGLWLWLAACGGVRSPGGARAWSGVAGLLFTSIHMTLLGSLFALAPRVLYHRHETASALGDQHLGGGLMLLVGGASYLSGGLWLAMTALRTSAPPAGANR